MMKLFILCMIFGFYTSFLCQDPLYLKRGIFKKVILSQEQVSLWTKDSIYDGIWTFGEVLNEELIFIRIKEYNCDTTYTLKEEINKKDSLVHYKWELISENDHELTFVRRTPKEIEKKQFMLNQIDSIGYTRNKDNNFIERLNIAYFLMSPLIFSAPIAQRKFVKPLLVGSIIYAGFSVYFNYHLFKSEVLDMQEWKLDKNAY